MLLSIGKLKICSRNHVIINVIKIGPVIDSVVILCKLITDRTIDSLVEPHKPMYFEIFIFYCIDVYIL